MTLIEQYAKHGLALFTMPGHDEPWTLCPSCDGHVSRSTCPYGRMGSNCCGACDDIVCDCAWEHPGIAPWGGDWLEALLALGAFTQVRRTWDFPLTRADFAPVGAGAFESDDIPF